MVKMQTRGGTAAPMRGGPECKASFESQHLRLIFLKTRERVPAGFFRGLCMPKYLERT